MEEKKMLRSNSKQARENIRKYIRDNFDPESYGHDKSEFETFEAAAAFILETFRSEKDWELKLRRSPEAAIFADWCAGLPDVIDTCYYYNRSAVDDLGAILEETEAERNRYSEADAEKLLTSLIYRELMKGGDKA
jgi:hypothetical protein